MCLSFCFQVGNVLIDAFSWLLVACVEFVTFPHDILTRVVHFALVIIAVPNESVMSFWMKLHKEMWQIKLLHLFQIDRPLAR